MRRLSASDEDLDVAVDLLRSGALVALPTETVYGLGADAANPAAVRAIFAAKGRPADHPVIVHLPSASALDDWAAEVPETARRLANEFWPGPLTLVLSRAAHVDPVITGGQDTIGLRVPAHPVAQALLHRFGGAVAAPSANRFGHVSPTTADHVQSEFGDEVAAVLDGGPCEVGVESTIVDLSSGVPHLLRPGMIPAEALEHVLKMPLEVPADQQGPRASGRLPSHYAPRAPVRLVPGKELTGAVAVAAERGPVAVLSHQPGPAPRPGVHWQSLPDDPDGYAHELYAALRAADETNPWDILVEEVPESDAWAAIADRLARAAA
jgi:L-threonylcarbamoyladenylate synthase